MVKKLDLLLLQKNLMYRQAQILDYAEFRTSAILVPLITLEGRWHVVFEVRSKNLRRQPGEICFPGGRIDVSDPSPMYAAVRETCEELGIKEEEIEVWGPLDYLVTPFKMVIYPFVGQLHVDLVMLEPNEAEVGEVFTVPLDFLLETTPDYYELNLYTEPQEGFPFHLIPQQENYRFRNGSVPEYFYFYQEYVIWGMTARILHHFLKLVKQDSSLSI